MIVVLVFFFAAARFRFCWFVSKWKSDSEVEKSIKPTNSSANINTEHRKHTHTHTV